MTGMRDVDHHDGPLGSTVRHEVVSSHHVSQAHPPKQLALSSTIPRLGRAHWEQASLPLLPSLYLSEPYDI